MLPRMKPTTRAGGNRPRQTLNNTPHPTEYNDVVCWINASLIQIQQTFRSSNDGATQHSTPPLRKAPPGPRCVYPRLVDGIMHLFTCSRQLTLFYLPSSEPLILAPRKKPLKKRSNVHVVIYISSSRPPRSKGKGAMIQPNGTVLCCSAIEP